MPPTDKLTTRVRRSAVADKSAGGRPHDDSQLALEVQALAELLLDIFEYKQERKQAAIACPEPPFLDAAPERHTM